MTGKRIIVYGGRGALGAACINYFKAINSWVANIDFDPNEKADYNITVSTDDTWVQQEEHVMSLLGTALKDQKVNAVLCVAGGWVGGNAVNNLSRKCDLMWRQSVWTSTIAATVAAKHLSPEGLLVLTGSKSALGSTPNMIGYGIAKAAVHHLTRTLSDKKSGLPDKALVVAILPEIFDTEINRKLLPKADFSSWTSLDFVTELFNKWIMGIERPPSGSLVSLVTKHKVTKLILPSLQGFQSIKGIKGESEY